MFRTTVKQHVDFSSLQVFDGNPKLRSIAISQTSFTLRVGQSFDDFALTLNVGYNVKKSNEQMTVSTLSK